MLSKYLLMISNDMVSSKNEIGGKGVGHEKGIIIEGRMMII